MSFFQSLSCTIVVPFPSPLFCTSQAHSWYCQSAAPRRCGCKFPVPLAFSLEYIAEELAVPYLVWFSRLSDIYDQSGSALRRQTVSRKLAPLHSFSRSRSPYSPSCVREQHCFALNLSTRCVVSLAMFLTQRCIK